MGSPIVHFEIHGSEMGKMSEFYSSLFSWKIDSNNPWNYGMVDTGGEGGINGGIAGGNEFKGVMVYAQVEDLQGYLDKAISLGATLVMPPTEIPGAVTLAMFDDPDGNRIGLVKGSM